MPHRTFLDRRGRRWEVWEVNPSMVERREREQDVARERRRFRQPRSPLSPRLRDGWLAFESKADKRRLAPIPPGWAEMADEDLDILLERAWESGAPRRLIE